MGGGSATGDLSCSYAAPIARMHRIARVLSQLLSDGWRAAGLRPAGPEHMWRGGAGSGWRRGLLPCWPLRRCWADRLHA